MADFLSTLLITAGCAWLAALPILPLRRAAKIPAGIRLALLSLPAVLMLVPLPLLFHQTKILPASAPLQIGGVFPLAGPFIPPSGGEAAAAPVLLGTRGTVTVIVGLWGAGAAICLISQLAAFLSLRRFFAQRQAPPQEVTEQVAQLCGSLGIRRPPQAAVCPPLHTPLLTGILRPAILLPSVSFSSEELSLILRHELTHLKKRHLLLQALVRLAAAVHWFHPLGWLLLRWIPPLCEEDCDQTVSSALSHHQRKQYGLVVLRFSGAPAYSGCASLTSPRQNMERRLRSIMNPTHTTAKAKWLTALAAAVLCCSSCAFSYAVAPADVQSPQAPVSSQLGELPVENLPTSEEALPELPESAVSSKETPSEAPEASSSDVAQPPTEEISLLSKGPVDESVQQAQPSAEKTEEEEIPVSHPLGQATVSAAFGQINLFTYHEGLDLAADKGSEISAFCDGTVLEAAFDSKDGNYLILDHGGGLTTMYAHCDSLLVEAGEAVQRGQAIATVGQTGNATGPHLHFEIRQDGQSLDPEPYLD